MIPKIIHYFWFGHGELPKTEKMCIESWKKFCPDYEIIRWDESNYDITKNEYMKEAYSAGKWGFISDYARLDILYQYGGFYLDTDVELLRSLDDFRGKSAFMGFENTSYVAPGLGMGAQVHHPFFLVLMQVYERQHFIKPNGMYNLITIPSIVTKLLVERGLVLDNSYQELNEVTIYPTEYFCPLDYDTGILNITENTYSIHHYSASWVPEEERRARAVRMYMADKFGKKKGLQIAKIVNMPVRLKIHLKEKGITGTLAFAIEKLLKREG